MECFTAASQVEISLGDRVTYDESHLSLTNMLLSVGKASADFRLEISSLRSDTCLVRYSERCLWNRAVLYCGL